jgi:tRNA nucleotidyltransferase (CCA-adding enzyme)
MSEDELNRVLEEARRQLSPAEEEERRLMGLANELMIKVGEYAKPYEAIVELGGSLAKGTWLKDDVDIDIFVKFPAHMSERELEEKGVKIGLSALQGHQVKLRYAEHPYVEGFVNGIRVNVVPCFSVKLGEWKTIADRSPYHVRWVKERINENLKQEIRLLKAFTKRIRVYGAEIEVEGLSGLVCELLIINYGNFTNLVKAMASWRPGMPLTPTDLKYLRAEEPILLLDPIDPGRNLGRAISQRQMARFCLACRAFIKRPHISYFAYRDPSRVSPYYFLSSPLIPQLVLLVFKHQQRSEDVLFGQLKKTIRHLVNQLRQLEFVVWHAQVLSNREDESGFVFLLDKGGPSPYKLKIGPSAFDAIHSEDFLTRNLKDSLMSWVDEEGRIRTVARRKVTSASALLRSLVEAGSGVAAGLRQELSGAHIYEGLEIIEALDKHQWLLPQLSRFIQGDVSELFNP